MNIHKDDLILLIIGIAMFIASFFIPKELETILQIYATILIFGAVSAIVSSSRLNRKMLLVSEILADFLLSAEMNDKDVDERFELLEKENKALREDLDKLLTKKEENEGV